MDKKDLSLEDLRLKNDILTKLCDSLDKSEWVNTLCCVCLLLNVFLSFSSYDDLLYVYIFNITLVFLTAFFLVIRLAKYKKYCAFYNHFSERVGSENSDRLRIEFFRAEIRFKLSQKRYLFI